MTVGTYADEFAENHFHTMVARNSASAFVPSAGTGFALSRKIIDSFNGDDVFPQDSLTEDYKLSLTLKQKGFHLHYVLETIERLTDQGRVVREYVSTRSRFPSTFRTAVRQKTRWLYGITMQSFKFRDIFKKDEMNFIHKYSLYKDWKAKFGNIVNLFGYMALVYFILSFFFTLPVMYPEGSISWYLCVGLTIMMIERQLMRAIAIKNVYGWKSALIGCFFPPLLPIRMVWGNIINLVATLKAWQQLIRGGKASKSKNPNPKKQKWDKTDHEFLDKSTLRRFHRNLGDVLLEKNVINLEDLKTGLLKSRSAGRRIGDILIENNSLSNEAFLKALAQVQQTLFVPDDVLIATANPFAFDISLLKQLGAVPLYENEDTLVVAVSGGSLGASSESWTGITDKLIRVVYSNHGIVEKVLRGFHSSLGNRISLNMLSENFNRSAEQSLIAMDYAIRKSRSTEEILSEMGILPLESDLTFSDLSDVETPIA